MRHKTVGYVQDIVIAFLFLFTFCSYRLESFLCISLCVFISNSIKLITVTPVRPAVFADTQ